MEHKKLGTWMGKKIEKKENEARQRENNDGRKEKNTDRLKS